MESNEGNMVPEPRQWPRNRQEQLRYVLRTDFSGQG